MIFELLEETLKKTNIEPPFTSLHREGNASQRKIVTLVTGHIDSTGKVQVFEEQGKNLYLQVQVPKKKLNIW